MRKGLTITAAAVVTVLVLTEAATAYYSPAKGRFLARDPIGEKGGANLYEFIGDDPVNSWDLLGLRDKTLREVEIETKLKGLSAKAREKKEEEFANALDAVIKDWNDSIASQKGKKDPVRLRILGAAFELWVSPESTYLHKEGGDYNCNLFVARVLRDAEVDKQFYIVKKKEGEGPASAGDWYAGSSGIKGVWKEVYRVEARKQGDKASQGREVVTLETHHGVEVTVRTRGGKPGTADVEAMTNETDQPGQNEAHVGIYLGHDLFISASGLRYLNQGEVTGIEIQFSAPNSHFRRVVYRSVPESAK